MNWIKALNDTDKEFYDKCADIAISAMYQMEEVTDGTLEIFQALSIRLCNDKNMTVEDMMEKLEKSFSVMKSLYLLSEKRFKLLYDLYSKETNRILASSNVQNFNLVKKRIKLSEIKTNNTFKQSMKELSKLGDNLIKDCITFQDEFFIVEKELAKENMTENITNEINKTFEKTKEKYNKIFKQRDLIKYLEENGFTYKNTGRHANFTNGVKTIPIPIHGSKELGYGLQRKIQKEIIEHKNMI